MQAYLITVATPAESSGNPALGGDAKDVGEKYA